MSDRPRSELEQALQSYRSALLRRDAAAQTILLQSYAVVRRRLDSSIAALGEAIGEVQKDGGISDGALARRLRGVGVQQLRGESYGDALNRVLARQQTLLAQTAEEIQRLATTTGVRIEVGQSAMIDLGLAHANGLMGATLPPGMTFNRLPKEALRELVGTLSDGSPLNDVLGQYGETAAESIREALIAGVATGQHPRAIAFGLGKALGKSAVGLMRLTRTTALHAYRTAALESYRANTGVVMSWIWTAAKSSRTCLNCLSRDGSEWPLEKTMPAHVSCRCTMRPKVIGVPARAGIETGAEWFARQDESTQRTMMGVQAHAAFQRGEIKLQDFQGHRVDPRWGATTYQRSLREVMRG